jgi:hypothetical protein
MSGTMAKKKKARRHDSIVQGELPLLWPDASGTLNTPTARLAGSSALLLPRSQLSPRKEVIRARRLLLSQSFSSWLSSKNSAGVGYGRGALSLFEMWLSLRLESCAFNCESVAALLDAAGEEIALEKWDAVQLLLKVTRPGERFKSEGGFVSFR